MFLVPHRRGDWPTLLQQSRVYFTSRRRRIVLGQSIVAYAHRKGHTGGRKHDCDAAPERLERLTGAAHNPLLVTPTVEFLMTRGARTTRASRAGTSVQGHIRSVTSYVLRRHPHASPRLREVRRGGVYTARNP